MIGISSGKALTNRRRCFFRCTRRSPAVLAAQINFLRGKGQLGDHIFLCGPAVEGIIFRGDIHIVRLAQRAEIIFHMKAVGLGGLTVDGIPFPAVGAFQPETIFNGVGQLCPAKGNIPPDPGQGVHLHLIAEGIFAPFDLPLYLLPFPFKPVGNVVKLRFTLHGFQTTVLSSCDPSDSIWNSVRQWGH